MVDRYTKVVLTVIAFALVAIAARDLSPNTAIALGGTCGDSFINPCYIASSDTLDVRVVNDVSMVSPVLVSVVN